MIRLRRAHLRRFRGLAPDTVLEFGDAEVFLLGRNGTGKSTLLRLLSALVHLDLKGLVELDPGVDVAWTLEGPGLEPDRRTELELRLRASPAEALFASGVAYAAEADVGLELAPEVALDGELREGPPGGMERGFTFRVDTQGDVALHVHPEQEEPPAGRRALIGRAGPLHPDVLEMIGAAAHRAGSAPRVPQLVRGRSTLLNEITRRCRPRGGAGGVAPPMDEGLAAFHQIAGAGGASGVSLHPVGTVARAGVPRELAAAIAAAGGAPPDQAALPLNRALADALGASAIDFLPRLFQRDADETTTWRGFDVLVTWPDGSRHRHDQLSFGQKRLIAHHWMAALEPELPYFADELTNGLHADWVDQIGAQLEGRQSFHALQNPLLLDMLGPREVDAIQRGLVLCEVRLDGERRVWTWRNPTAEEAEGVKRSRDAGFQQLSEVLRGRGLW